MCADGSELVPAICTLNLILLITFFFCVCGEVYFPNKKYYFMQVLVFCPLKKFPLFFIFKPATTSSSPYLFIPTSTLTSGKALLTPT